MTCTRLDDEGLIADLGGELDPHVESCEDCRKRRDELARVAALVADGKTARTLPVGWKERTLARARAAPAPVTPLRRRSRAVIWAAGAALAAAAVILFLILRPADDPAPGEPRLAVVVKEVGGWRGQAHPGNIVVAEPASVAAKHVEVRVYREARAVVARCPGGGEGTCKGAALTWTVPSVGKYQIVLLTSDAPIPAPHGSLDDDMAAATAAGARAVDVETLDVL